jgi:hypothetical protein
VGLMLDQLGSFLTPVADGAVPKPSSVMNMSAV